MRIMELRWFLSKSARQPFRISRVLGTPKRQEGILESSGYWCNSELFGFPLLTRSGVQLQTEKKPNQTPKNHNYYLYVVMKICYNLEIFLTSVVKIEDQMELGFFKFVEVFVTNVFVCRECHNNKRKVSSCNIYFIWCVSDLVLTD